MSDHQHGIFNVWSATRKDRAPIVGIDLGTSTSCISIWNSSKSRAKIIKNHFSGKRTTPSILEFKDVNDPPIVPYDSLSYDSPTNRVANWKRLLSCEKDTLSHETLDYLGAEEDENDSSLCVRCFTPAGVSILVRPEVLSSHVLKELKLSAEKYLRKNHKLAEQLGGTEVKRAVIGIPVRIIFKKIVLV